MTKTLKYIIYVTLAFLSACIIAISGTVLYVIPKLPHVDTLTEIKLQTPLRIYTTDGHLIGEFGDKKRTPATIDEIPEQLKTAFLSAEDAGFYHHSGFSFKGLSRALIQAITQSPTQTGGSTITQQVAKNYFLSPERTIIRKIREILLAVQMEDILSKDKILELYLNKIFLGNRVYGVVAAAQVYYGKSLDELTLAQSAMIAGLPKAPSRDNPIRNPVRAKERRDWILGRMLELEHITEADYLIAINEPLSAKKHGVEIEAYAPFVAEMARQRLANLLGEDAMNDGYTIYTTINTKLQAAADRAIKKGLESYDWRHGYRKVEAHLDEITEDTKEALFDRITQVYDLEPALIVDISPDAIHFELEDGSRHDLPFENGIDTLRPYISENERGPSPKTAHEAFRKGDVIRVRKKEDTWHLTQLPEIEGALVSLDSYNGAIRALIGGYDFFSSKFNRVTQARRQMGSNMKPFFYSAAIHEKLNPASIINDAPIVFHDNNLENAWRPTNDGGRFLGPIRLRVGLYRSRNLVSIRILQQIGISYARNYVTRFGFEKSALPRNLSLVLGSASFTPMEVARAYAVFANKGYLVSPYLIDRILDSEGHVIYEANPALACDQCLEKNDLNQLTDHLIGDPETASIVQPANRENAPSAHQYAPRVIPEADAFIMDSMLRDVTKKGTGWKAGKALERNDIGGKTGTTNGPTDTWFSGYHPKLVTVVWAGMDNNTPLGNREYGGTVALPIWMDFMQTALKDIPYSPLVTPPGVVSVLINKQTGLRASPGQANTMFEYFKKGEFPKLKIKAHTETNVDLQDIFQ